MPDIEIKLGGGVYHLRPTFGAMREIEAKTGSSCATLLQLLAKQELHAAEMAQIVYHGASEGGATVELESIGKRIFEKGVGSPEVRNPISAYLIELLYAPDSARKKDVGEWWQVSEQITSLMFSAPHISSDGDPETSGDPLPESSGASSRPSVKRQTQPSAPAETPEA